MTQRSASYRRNDESRGRTLVDGLGDDDRFTPRIAQKRKYVPKGRDILKRLPSVQNHRRIVPRPEIKTVHWLTGLDDARPIRRIRDQIIDCIIRGIKWHPDEIGAGG